MARSLQAPFIGGGAGSGSSAPDSSVVSLSLAASTARYHEADMDVESLFSEILEPTGSGLLNMQQVVYVEMQKAERVGKGDDGKIATQLVKNCSHLATKYEAQFRVCVQAAGKKRSMKGLDPVFAEIEQLKTAGVGALNQASGWWPEPIATFLLTP